MDESERKLVILLRETQGLKLLRETRDLQLKFKKKIKSIKHDLSCLALDEFALGTGCEIYFQCLDWSDQSLEVTISTCIRECIQYIVLNRRSRSSQDSQPQLKMP